MIRDELEAHDPALLDKPMLVAFNKIDRPAAAAAWPAFRDARRRDGLPCVAISAATGDGRRRSSERSWPSCSPTPPSSPRRRSRPASSSTGSSRSRDGFAVEREADGAFRVRAGGSSGSLPRPNFNVEESAERFQRDLARLGVEAELRRAGIEAGDTVRIGAVELEWDREAWEAG